MFVIIAFNETLLAKAVNILARIPFVGNSLQAPFKSFLERQQNKFRRKPGTGGGDQVCEI